MASNQANTGGYDCKWAEDPPDELLCVICLDVARDPHQHGDSQCGKMFCRSCITEYQKENNNACPNCRKPLTAFQDARSARQIQALKVKCDNLDNGCQWVGELGSLEDHLLTCGHTLLPCTNQCENNDQIVKVLRKDLQKHLAKKCPRRQYECPLCKDTGEYQDMTNSHHQTCPKVKVRCPNGRCPVSIRRCEVQQHRPCCDYEPVSCLYQCKKNGQIMKVLRKHLGDHLTNKCPRRQYQCQHCKETGEYQERTTTHLQTCPRVKVRCPNAECQVSILRCEVPHHRSICDYEHVSCKYAEIGCKERPLRKDLKNHEEDDQLHLRVSTETVLELKKNLQAMTETVLELKNFKATATTVLQAMSERDQETLRKLTRLEETVNTETSSRKTETTSLQTKLQKSTARPPCTFTLTSFQKHKSDIEEFFSPPFYISYTGYKMCLQVDANGNSDGKGTHISVFAYLMKGDNDYSLTRPFTGTITVELLNQLEDKNHHKETATFHAAHEFSGRVINGERFRVGWGSTKYISHRDLDYKTLKLRNHCQYLKDDTLIFRVSVQASDYKPWLECTI